MYAFYKPLKCGDLFYNMAYLKKEKKQRERKL
jgi:hypothetical protein